MAGQGSDAEDNGRFPLRCSTASAPAFLLDARNNDITHGARPCRAVQRHSTSTGCQHDSKFCLIFAFNSLLIFFRSLEGTLKTMKDTGLDLSRFSASFSVSSLSSHQLSISMAWKLTLYALLANSVLVSLSSCSQSFTDLFPLLFFSASLAGGLPSSFS